METSLFIYGRHPVLEMLERDPEKMDKIYVRDSLTHASIAQIHQLASQHHIPVQKVPPRKLAELVGSVNDQGIVAQISPIAYWELREWLDELDLNTKPLVILLDEIEDPHNFGAILRTAAAVQASGVIVPKHRQAPITPAVIKTSAGTAGRVPVVRVVNVNAAIRDLQQAGFWIYALDQTSDTVLWDHAFDTPVALIVGSEGKGIRTKTLELSDFQLNIPMENQVESLNASVSAALVMYEWRRQRYVKST